MSCSKQAPFRSIFLNVRSTHISAARAQDSNTRPGDRAPKVRLWRCALAIRRRMLADLNEVPSACGSGHGSSRHVIVHLMVRTSHVSIRINEHSLQAADSRKKSIQTPSREIWTALPSSRPYRKCSARTSVISIFKCDCDTSLFGTGIRTQ